MAEWDDEDFEPGELTEEKGDAWEGEDEEEIKENWDDEEEEQDKLDETDAKPSTTVVKKKSTVKQKILEKEKKKKEELARKAELKEKGLEDDDEDDDDEDSIFSSKLDEKLRNQKLVEKSDLEIAKDLLGDCTDELDNPDKTNKGNVDIFNPTNEEEFIELAKMLTEKLSKLESFVEYTGFLEVLFRDLASGLKAEDVKKLATVVNAIATEKQKAQKAASKKKKGKKAALGGSNKGAKGADLEDYSTYGDDYDFI
ncbi:eukaryotic translation initiation factor 3 subunit J-like isoform X2 [Xenia sp. Carnegie-2017]|uniref:eukaryotic translation initiation factor 3 subunit J-like isoform X2 n=1 Tax=Xenia sp. Carnegie-2017 TaxID=2897299 RepID=UPI001F04D1C4|nr:eukaryotic translation initiation factor 3 subunit J-like isoform X2 [Xenia sp. Carnegie-2017]